MILNLFKNIWRKPTNYMKLKFNSLFLIIAFVFITCKPNVAETRLDGLRFYTKPEIVLKELEKRETLNPAEHFFIANLYKNKKELKKALFHYMSSVFLTGPDKEIALYPDPVYKYVSKKNFRSSYYDPSLYHIADLFYSYQEYEYVLKYLDLISVDDPALYFNVIKLGIDTNIKLKQYDEAVAYFDSRIEIIKNEDLIQTLLIRKASAYEKAEQYTEAVNTYYEVIRNGSNRWQAHSSSVQIDRLINEHTISITDQMKTEVAGALISAKKIDAAAALIDSVSEKNELYSEVLLRLLLHQNKNQQADVIINSAKNQPDTYNKLRLIKADYFYYSRKSTAIRIYRDLIDTGGDYQREFSRVCYYLYRNSPSAAASYMLKYIKQYPDTPAAQEFLWFYTRSFILKNDTKRVLPILESITNRPENRYYGNAAYYQLRYYRSINDKKKADEFFKKMVAYAPDSWYTWIEANRIKDDFDEQQLADSFRNALENIDSETTLFSHFMLYLKSGNEAEKTLRIMAIKNAGLYPYTEFENYITAPLESIYVDLFKTYYEAGYVDGINALFEYLDDSDENKKLKYYVMSNFGDMYGNYYYAYLGSARLYREFNIKENISLFSTEYSKRLFPLAFKDIVEKVSEKYPKVHPLQIFSVMKAESAYNHVAESHAGATGLMQVMPATGAGNCSWFEHKRV
jgi:soluble lytic murein transglycosylase-like protein